MPVDRRIALSGIHPTYLHINPYGIFELDMAKRLPIDWAMAA